MKNYSHVISLGFFCSTALELEKIGLRDSSYPFDWLITDFKGVLECIESDFDGFLQYENLSQYRRIPEHYFDKKYQFHFYHDFSAYKSLDEQITFVQEKYHRRIQKFVRNITQPTLFIRYVSNQKELNFIEKDYKQIIDILKSKNENNELLLIANDQIKSKTLKIFNVEKDEGDVVARTFLEKNADLKELLLSDDIYDKNKRALNLDIYNKKQENKSNSNYQRITSKIRKLLKRTYVHSAIYSH